MLYREYDNMIDCFIDINREIIFNEKYITRTSNMNLIEDLIIDLKSTGMPGFNLAPLGYTSVTKATLLYGQYIDTAKLHNLIELSKGEKGNTKNTITMDFNEVYAEDEGSISMPFKKDQGCIKTLVLCRDNPRQPYTRMKVFFRASEMSRKLVPDLLLLTWLCDIIPGFELDKLTLYIAQGYLVPAILANTHDTILGLHKDMFDPDNNFQRSILCGIRRIENHDPTKPNAGKGCYGRLEQMKWKELRGEPYKLIEENMYYEAFTKRYKKECEELNLSINIK